jgi:hypothetical protein
MSNETEAKANMKTIRVSEWKAMIEQEIQRLLIEATELRKTINESKTSTKKQYYTKKFKKISIQTVELLTTLQSITDSQPAPIPDPTSTLNLTPNHDTEQTPAVL